MNGLIYHILSVRQFGSRQVAVCALIFAFCCCFAVSNASAQVSMESAHSSVSEGAADTLREAAPGLQRQRDEMQDVANPNGTNPDSTDDTSLDATDSNDSASNDAQTTGTMSAEQIIKILQQEPEILQRIKEQVAQQSGTDPATITDKSFLHALKTCAKCVNRRLQVFRSRLDVFP